MDLNKIITGDDLCTIEFSLNNRIEFLLKKIDEYSYSPSFQEFYNLELEKVTLLSKKLNITLLKITL
jgi:hypothetical protein